MSMFKVKGMPNHFLVEVSCAVYFFLNRSPTMSVPSTTSIVAWNGFKSNVQHLKLFGSISYSHVPLETRTNLDDKVVNIIFIWYK